MTARPTRILKADPGAIAAAARCLAAGGLVAFPTETVYGLGADAANGQAVARLYAAKGRPAFNPLICHVADRAAAARLGRLDDAAARLAAAFWPGPLTLVVPAQPDGPVASLATAGLSTLGLRVPDHPVARAIIAAFGGPVVAPSANASGHISPTTAQHVAADLSGRIDLIIDGGATPLGLESTIVACLEQPLLLRPGGLPRGEIERVLGRALKEAPPLQSGTEPPRPSPASGGGRERAQAGEEAGSTENEIVRPIAPGQLASHYAPRAKLRLHATHVNAGEALLAFGPTLPQGASNAVRAMNLSARGDLIEAAANLFAHLRALDAVGVNLIAVMPIPQEGLGEAINDRLRRAQAPRDALP